MKEKYHIPVMKSQIADYLNLGAGDVVLDATIGTAGHSLEILRRILPGGMLIGIDRDEESLAVARRRLSDYGDACRFVHGNFSDIGLILKELNVRKVNGILFDLGISSFQLENPERGFSFQCDGPLDMRMDRSGFISAYDLVNNLNEEELSTLLWNFGQERWHNRIAHLLVNERQKHSISTTQQLSEIVVRALPPRYRYRHFRIHPATRTFQAVRIAVNHELDILDKAIEKAVDVLENRDRICVISFHSLEDRIVKLAFRRLAACGQIDIVTPKPIVPQEEEIKNNPSSRSAKLRVAERRQDETA